jgi:hypothetical protein
MRIVKGLVTVGLFAFAALQADAVTYNDTVGDQGAGNSTPIMDITSVEVTHNATDLIFKINLNGDPIATDWGKYCIGFDTTAGGDPVGDGWARPIGMSLPDGMDYWVGSWVDGPMGAQLWQWTGSWNIIAAPSISKDTSSVTLQFPYAPLGLTSSSSFNFDVYTTGGGGSDTAVDSLANPAPTVAGWSDYYNSGNLTHVYTIPEPSTLVLVGLGGLMLMCRRFFRRA